MSRGQRLGSYRLKDRLKVRLHHLSVTTCPAALSLPTSANQLRRLVVMEHLIIATRVSVPRPQCNTRREEGGRGWTTAVWPRDELGLGPLRPPPRTESDLWRKGNQPDAVTKVVSTEPWSLPVRRSRWA